MYKKKNEIIGSKESLDNYVEGYDIYNSELLHLIDDPSIEREPYEITVYDYRPDLIAEDFYQSRNYLGLVLIQTRLLLSQFKRGMVLYLIPKTTLDSIIASI